MKLRTYKGPPTQDLIPEAIVFDRVLDAIRTLHALPDGERRFLAAGTKSAWPAHLVEFADLVAQAEITPDEDTRPQRFKPTRAQISDATVAGAWWAQLVLMSKGNVDEFLDRSDLYRAGRVSSRLIFDQRIVEAYAVGFSVKAIGEREGRKSEHEIYRNLYRVARDLWSIANGLARIAHHSDRVRLRRAHGAAFADHRARA